VQDFGSATRAREIAHHRNYRILLVIMMGMFAIFASLSIVFLSIQKERR